jgi:hypothetical protein
MLTLLDCYVPFGKQRIVMQRRRRIRCPARSPAATRPCTAAAVVVKATVPDAHFVGWVGHVRRV